MTLTAILTRTINMIRSTIHDKKHELESRLKATDFNIFRKHVVTEKERDREDPKFRGYPLFV